MPIERVWLIAMAAVVPATVAFVAYRVLDLVVERLLPERLGRRLAPFVFVGPAVVLVFVGLVIPALITVWISFQNNRSGEWAGLANYERVLSNPAMVDVLINTALWTLVVPVVTVAFGLLIAVVADRLPGPMENLVKSIMFFPMAVSLVAAAVLWRFIYAYRPDDPQIGAANAVVTALGGEPVTWIIDFNYRLNTFALMVTGIWTTTGFAMVLLAAAIKNVPVETIEAARVDGAGGWSIFRRISRLHRSRARSSSCSRRSPCSCSRSSTSSTPTPQASSRPTLSGISSSCRSSATTIRAELPSWWCCCWSWWSRSCCSMCVASWGAAVASRWEKLRYRLPSAGSLAVFAALAFVCLV